jgi:hypothetical protein
MDDETATIAMTDVTKASSALEGSISWILNEELIELVIWSIICYSNDHQQDGSSHSIFDMHKVMYLFVSYFHAWTKKVSVREKAGSSMSRAIASVIQPLSNSGGGPALLDQLLDSLADLWRGAQVTQLTHRPVE